MINRNLTRNTNLILNYDNSFPNTLLYDLRSLNFTRRGTHPLLDLFRGNLHLYINHLRSLDTIIRSLLNLPRLTKRIYTSLIRVVPSLLRVRSLFTTKGKRVNAFLRDVLGNVRGFIRIRDTSPFNSFSTKSIFYVNFICFRDDALPCLCYFFEIEPPTSTNDAVPISLSRDAVPPNTIRLSATNEVFSDMPLQGNKSDDAVSGYSQRTRECHTTSPVLAQLQSGAPRTLRLHVVVFATSQFSSEGARHTTPQLDTSVPD